MANLLSIPSLFEVVREQKGCYEIIFNLSEAIKSARENKDQLFGSPDFNNSEIRKDVFSAYSSEVRNQLFPNMSEREQNLLAENLKLINRVTPGGSANYKELQSEFKGHCNSYCGLFNPNYSPLVHSKITHESMHREHVYSNDFDRYKNWRYFHKWFDGRTTIPINQMKGPISGHYVRVDSPKKDPQGRILHGETIQAHFDTTTKGPALKINGEWKHGEKKIDKVLKETFCKWGFKLPEKDYD